MDLIHLHLLLNHIPVIGMIIGLGLYILALVQKSDDLKRASLVLFLGLALLALPTYMSGNAAYDKICPTNPTDPNAPCADAAVSRPFIQAHNDAALAAFAFIQLTGIFAWLGLWQYRRISQPTRFNLTAVLLLSIVTVALMSLAGNTGGDIRHQEIKGTLDNSMAWANAAGLGKFVTGVPWMWPTCETLHFIGLSLLFGVVLAVDLRMLGVAKSVPFPALHRLLPWAILGFGINVLTGMLFFIGASGQYITNTTFHWKIVLVLIAGVNALYFTVFDQPWVVGAGDDAPFTAKAFALSAILLWTGIMFCGSMLPFLGNSF